METLGYVLIGEGPGGLTVLGEKYPDEGSANDAAGEYIDDEKYDRLHVAEIITTIG
jgi:hypothetical protein